MSLTFEWDEKKADDNLRKHGVSFDESKTVFNDPFSVTIHDPDHSSDEQRYIDIGLSSKGRNMKTSKKNNEVNEMREEYDFSGGVRGKHFEAYRKGHTLKIDKRDGSVEVHYFTQEDGAVMLDPDVKKHFPDSKSVNKALRSLITTH